MVAKHTTRPQILDAAERRAYVLEQRKGGHSYRVIAQLVIRKFGLPALPKGYDERYACADVHVELKRLNEQNAEAVGEILRLEVERLDAALASIWEKVLAGQMGAIDRYIAISRRRAELQGLDAPRKLAGSGDNGEFIVRVIREDKRPSAVADGN